MSKASHGRTTLPNESCKDCGRKAYTGEVMHYDGTTWQGRCDPCWFQHQLAITLQDHLAERP